jgi:hypothetical protein
VWGSGRGRTGDPGSLRLACAAGFLAARAVLCLLVSPTPIGGRRIEWAREHAADYGTLFVGSSRAFRQVMPERGRPHAALDLERDPRPAPV